MNKCIFFGLLIILQSVTYAQNALWSAKKDFAFRTWIRKVCTDHRSNTYALSLFEGDYHNPSDKFGFAISKHDSTGNLIWEKVILDKFAYPRGYDLQCDQLGNLFFIGNTGDSVSIEGQTLSEKNGRSFIIKYDSAGLMQWVHQYNALNYSISPDNSGNCYLTGFLSGTDHFGAFTLDNSSSTSVDNGILLVKFSTGGQVQWAKTFGSWLSQGKIVSYANNGALLVCATFNDDTCHIGNNTFLSSNGSTVMFAVDTTGTVKWARQFNSMVNFKCCRPYKNNSFIVGAEFSGNVSFTPFAFSSPITNVDVIITRVDALGNILNAKQLTGPSNESCSGTDHNNSGEIYFSCSTEQTSTFDGHSVTANGVEDYFITVIDSLLNFHSFIKQEAGTNGANEAYSISASNKKLIIGGCFTNDIYLGQSHYISGGFPKGFLAYYTLDSLLTRIQEPVTPLATLKIFPNPTQGIFQINYSSTEKNKLILNVSNARGQIIYTETISNFDGEYKKELDLSKHAKGVYFIEIVAGKKRSVKKIIVE